MKIVAGGDFPRRLLNQFSMDEYGDYLRVATTVGRANAVYILDRDLKIVSSLEGFGEAERIYAVRFIADSGYVVTFRETDPFFVIDLSKPENPKMAGELKIPGFSSAPSQEKLSPWCRKGGKLREAFPVRCQRSEKSCGKGQVYSERILE